MCGRVINLVYWGTSMRKAFWLSLALVAVLGFSVSNAFARGGHGGGGHHGGGHRGGHGGHHSHAHSHHHTGHHDHHGFHHHYHHSNWAHHNRPFSHGWYGRHGGTWGYGWGGWGWGNPWAISTFGATAAWLGLEAASPYYGNYGSAPVNNVLTADSEDAGDSEDTVEPATSESDAADESTDTVSAPTPEQVAKATELASSGKQDPPKNTSFLPLGVFSIAPQGQTEASALVQLAVSKDGLLRGSYYDLLTDHDQPIRGTVNKKTQEVAFTFGINGKVTFETTLPNLTQDKGTLAAHFENGKTSNWTLARYEKEPTDEEAGEKAPESSEDADDEDSTSEPQKETAVQ